MCLLPQYEQVAITDITKQLQDANLFNKPGILQTVWVLHGLIDKDETVTVGDVKHKRGATCPVAQETIAGLIGVSRRATAHGYLKELIEADILRVEKASIGGRNCFRYIFTIFDLYAEEAKTCTVKEDSPDEDVRQNEEPVRSNDETCTHQGVHNQYIQEIQEKETPVSDCPGPNEETEKRGDSLIEEKQEIDVVPVSEAESVEPEEKASLEEKKEGADFVPTKQIAEVVDSLAKGMNMNVSDPDPDLEQMFRSLNPQSGVVVTGLDLQVASKLKEQLIGVLSSAAIEMPPMLFFKHCIQEMDNRVADGKIQVRPTSLNFFLNAHTGKEIVADRVEKLRSENQAANNIEKTNAYLQEQQERPRGMSAETKKELDKLLGRSG